MAKAGKYSLKERLNIEELYNVFIGLAPREQMFAAGGTILALLLIIFIPITCASSRLNKLEKQIDTHETSSSKILTKISEYQLAQNRLKGVQGKIRPKTEVQLRTKLANLATQNGISDNIDSLKDGAGQPGVDFEEQIVTVNANRLSLNQVTEFLFNIENQPEISMQVKRMTLKPRYDNRQQFDVNFDVSTFVTNQIETPEK